MKKKINFIIEGTCEDCPFCQFSPNYILGEDMGYDCKYPTSEVGLIVSDTVIRDWDSLKSNNNKLNYWPPIPETCPLEDYEESEVQKTWKHLKEKEQMNQLPDIQENSVPEIKEFIECVGIRKVKMPITFIENNRNYKVLANISMSTELENNVRALSLSEFMRYLKEYINKPIIIPDDIEILLNNFNKISRLNEFPLSTIKFEFDYMVDTRSLISNNSFPQFYPCFISFELIDEYLFCRRGVTVQYSSYCPCSKSLCENSGEGVPHAQRSYCDLIIDTVDCSTDFNKIINLIEECVVNKTYPIIRRTDEQQIAVTAEKNTYFIEDIIRKIKKELIELEQIGSIDDWIVRLRHEESIHTHEVFAIAWKGNNGGFGENTFL